MNHRRNKFINQSKAKVNAKKSESEIKILNESRFLFGYPKV